MSIIKENTFKIQFLAREELKALLASSSVEQQLVCSCAHVYLARFQGTDCPCPSWVWCDSHPPGASHAQRERDQDVSSCMDVHPAHSKREPAAWRGILPHLQLLVG